MTLKFYPSNLLVNNKKSLRIFPTASAFHPDTVNWRDRSFANGGLQDEIDVKSVDTFVLEMYRLGLRNTNGNNVLLDVMPFAGGNLAGCLTKLWHLPSAPTITNFNFVEGDYSRNSGLTGNGTSKYLNSNVILAGVLDNSVSFGVYNRSSGSSNGVEIGANSDPVNENERILFHVHFSFTGFADNPIVDCFSSTNNRINTQVNPAEFSGLIHYIRHSSNFANLYRKGIVIGQDNNLNTGTTPNISLFYFAENRPGGTVGFSSRSLGFVFVGTAIPINVNTAFTTAVEKLMSDLGRAV